MEFDTSLNRKYKVGLLLQRDGGILQACAPLAGYSQFIDDVRELKKKTENTREAVGIAIDMHPTDSPIKKDLGRQQSGGV